MSTAPVLAIPDEDEHYEMVCDACGYGIGAVLMQKERPVAYYSYKLNSAERNYPTGEQELLAVVKSFQHWRCYLEGCRGGVTVVTDHKPNTFLESKAPTQLSRRQVGWQQFLSRFHYKWSTGTAFITLLIHCHVTQPWWAWWFTSPQSVLLKGWSRRLEMAMPMTLILRLQWI